jgi:hypothetical protein
MPYAFGVDITYKFYAITPDGDYIALPSAPESVHVYKEGSKPSFTQAQAGTDNGGLLKTISTWSAISGDTPSAGTKGKQITIAAIDDPDPDGQILERTYWIAFNYKLQADGQTQTQIRALPMRRVTGHHKSIQVTPGKLDEVFDNVDIYVSSTVMNAHIQHAETLTKEALKDKGFEWAELWRPDQLESVMIYRALSQIMMSLIVDTGDQFDRRYEEFKKISETMLSGLNLIYDQSLNAEPDYKERFGRYARVVR